MKIYMLYRRSTMKTPIFYSNSPLIGRNLCKACFETICRLDFHEGWLKYENQFRIPYPCKPAILYNI